MSRRRRAVKGVVLLVDRDHALISEVIGFLCGYASGYNEDDHQYRLAEPLVVRLKNLRAKVWPVDG